MTSLASSSSFLRLEAMIRSGAIPSSAQRCNAAPILVLGSPALRPTDRNCLALAHYRSGACREP